MGYLDDKIKHVLIDQETITKRIQELGKQITEDYQDKEGGLILVGILKGAVVFTSELMKEIDLPVQLDFMSVSSYGHGASESKGIVRILKDLDEDILNKHVLIVEDIIDSGLTLSYLMDNILRRGAASVEIATLLDKPERRVSEVDAKYVGFQVPNEFIVGYGLDYSENYRNLPFVACIEI